MALEIGDYTRGGFANPLLVYTPTLSLPLFKGEGTPPHGKRRIVRSSNLIAALGVDDVFQGLARQPALQIVAKYLRRP